MVAEFKHTIRKLRGQAIAWSFGLILYGLLLVSMYDSVTNMQGISELLESYPQEILAFFGGMAEMTTPWGYLDVKYFSLINMIIGIFAIGTCIKLIAGDEEKGLLDLTLAHPISRLGFFWGRVMAFIFVISVILMISWASLVIPSKAFGFNLSPIELLRPFLSLFAVLMFFSTLALLASLILPSSHSAGMLTGLIMVGNFLLIGLSNLNSDLQEIIKITPMNYYQGGEAIKSLEWGWVAGLLIVSLTFVLFACIAFIKRDIRVSGEHSWSITGFPLINQARAGITSIKEKIYGFRILTPKEPSVKQALGKNRRKWIIISLAALGLILALCVIPLMIIDAANLWCDLFASFFNSYIAGTCP